MDLKEITHRPLVVEDYPVLVHRPDCSEDASFGWELWDSPNRLDAELLQEEPGDRVFKLRKAPPKRRAA